MSSKPRSRALVMSLLVLGGLTIAPKAFAFCRTAAGKCSPSSCPTDNPQCCVDDRGCPSKGPKAFWPSSCLGYSFNVKGSSILDPVRARVMISKAFDAWSLVDCGGGKRASMSAVATEDVACSKAEYDPNGTNVNLIVFRDDRWLYNEPGPIAPDTLAKTTVTFSTQTGEIFDADIEINSALTALSTTDPPDRVEYDLQSIMTHEVGHFLGIAHSDDPSAVMAPTYDRQSTTQRSLTPDDVAAICAAYPPDRAAPCAPLPHGGFGARCDDPPKSGCDVSPADDAPPSGIARFSALGLVGVLVGIRRAKRRIT